jgi:hypothetical protein
VGKAPFRCRPEHAGDNDIVAALRSKPEGLAETGPVCCSNLMLSRLGRCREAPGGTADDAFLTLEIPYCLRAGLTPRPHFLRSLPEVQSALGSGFGLIDEAAKPDIHHQTNRQENKQRGRTTVTHQGQRYSRYGHRPDDHGHIH